MADPVAQTAVGPMTIVAVEQYTGKEQRLVQDKLAYRFLPTGVKLFVWLARWRPLRNLLINLTERSGTGMWASFLCRKRYIDDKLRGSISVLDEVVILGAGLDTRAYRMPELTKIPVFEVDLPENIAIKRAKLQAVYGQVSAFVHLVPINFERQDLGTILTESGYRTNGRTFFIWEAVTQYLTEQAVRSTFDFLAKTTPGSRLVFTYIRQDFLDGVNFYGAEALYQRFRVKHKLWLFGMGPEQVASFLETYHWRELEQMGSTECVERYVRPSGREMTVSEVERFVYAEKI